MRSTQTLRLKRHGKPVLEDQAGLQRFIWCPDWMSMVMSFRAAERLALAKRTRAGAVLRGRRGDAGAREKASLTTGIVHVPTRASAEAHGRWLGMLGFVPCMRITAEGHTSNA